MKKWEILKAKEGGNKTCDAVMSQPLFPDVELRRIGEAVEKMISCEWFPTAAFGANWIDEWVESILVAVQGFAKP